MSKREEAKADVSGEAPIDLASYRRRAAEIAGDLKKAEQESGDRRIAVAGEAMVKLQALIEDLSSIGAEEYEVRALRDLRTEIIKALAAKKPDVDAIWKRSIPALEAFAGSTSGERSPAKRRGLAFWK